MTSALPHAAKVQAFVDGVLSGEIVAGRLVVAAVRRHVEDLRTAKAHGLVFDAAAASRAIDFIQQLQHTTGEFDGMPFLLEPWELFIVWCLFGWKRASDGLRRFREAFLSLGRGNGKTPFAAALLLFLMTCDQPIEPRAEVKIAATKRGQAEICFSECKRFIRKRPPLDRRCELLKHSIVYTPNGSSIQPLGKEDATSGDGFNLHAFVADEIHAWKEEHRDLWEKLETAMGKRRQPLAIVITTAGSDRSKLWLEQYGHSSKVVRGVYADDAHFSFIAQIDEADGDLPADDPFDPNVWVKANPNLGISVKRDYLERLATKAKANPIERNKFLRYHMNVRVRARSKIIDLKQWLACRGEFTLTPRSRAFLGLDLGWRDDLASLYGVYLLADGRLAVKGTNWICEEASRDLDGEPFASWIRAGRVRVTPGDTTDPDAIYAEVRRLKKAHQVESVAGDPNNARAPLIVLQNEIKVPTYEFFQSAKKYNEPLRVLLDLVKERRLVHDGDPVLTWAMDNLVVRQDSAGLMMPDKANSDEKIDPAVATLMALSESLYAERKPAGYESRGLRKLRIGSDT
jgi:phage terminase large subunit-like protein